MVTSLQVYWAVCWLMLMAPILKIWFKIVAHQERLEITEARLDYLEDKQAMLMEDRDH